MRLTRSKKRRRCIRSSSLCSASPSPQGTCVAEQPRWHPNPIVVPSVVLRKCVCVGKKEPSVSDSGPGACLGRSVRGSTFFLLRRPSEHHMKVDKDASQVMDEQRS